MTRTTDTADTAPPSAVPAPAAGPDRAAESRSAAVEHCSDGAAVSLDGWPESGGVACELVGQACAEHPALAALPAREQLLAAAWLASHRAARTRRAYAHDLTGWLAWLAARDVDVLAARRVHVDLYARAQLDAGAAASSTTRRLSALSSFYRYCAANDLIAGNPVTGVARPRVDPDQTTTVGLTRDQARALLAAADHDAGGQRLRTAAAIRMLLTNGLRVDELAGADVTDLGHDRGHRTLTVTRKGATRAAVALAPPTAAALDDYLTHRATFHGGELAALAGPLLATTGGRRLDQAALWRLVRRLAKAAAIPGADRLSPHSLRHTAITLALDAGAALRDVQDYAGHRDPRTTRRYDHARASLDRHAAYTVATYLAE